MDRGRAHSDRLLSRVYRYRLRSVLRRRWGDYLLLVLLIALVGGLAMGSVVAGRRTQSAYASFLAKDKASTLTMSTYGVYNGSSASNFSPRVEQEIRRFPHVAQVEAWVATFLAPLTPDGGANLKALASFNVAGPVDGLFFDEDRVTVIEGKMADPADPHVFMASESGARALGIRVGQTVEFGAFDETSVTTAGFGTPAVQPAARIPLRLVAIIEFNNTVVQDDADRVPTDLVITPALARTQESNTNGTWLAVRLKPGVKDIGRLEQQLLQLLPPGALGQFFLTSTVQAKVESALRPESIALGVFGLIAALAALGLCLPIMSRQLANSEDDRRVLRALGAPRAAVAADYCAGVTASVLAGTALACLVSAGVGSLAPLGPVRAVYHPGGFSMDWAVTAVGLTVLGGVLGGSAVIMSVRRSNPRRAAELASRMSAASRTIDVAAAAGLPAAAVVGARFAVEPGRGRASVAARSVLAGGIASITLVVTTLTFASGLRTLVSRPALYGWDWGYTLIGNSNVPPATIEALQRDHAVQSWSGYIAINVTLDGRNVPVLIGTDTLAVTPPLLAGHRITGKGQIIIGQATLSSMHKRIGETVQLGFGSPSTAPLYLPPQPFKVVGAATFPAISGSANDADHTSMGVGGLFSFASLPVSFLESIRNPDPVQNGPVLVFIRFRPGTRRTAAAADVRRLVGISNRQFAADPTANGNSVSYLPVQRPAAIVNYQSTGDTPLVLASGLAAAAVVALATSMITSVRRRRRELAVLKTLGFVRAQMIAAVATQALIIALISVAVGVPLGIAAGRQLWIAFAHSIYAVPEPTAPASVALVAVVAVLIAVAVAVVPGRLAAGTPAAAVLRTD